MNPTYISKPKPLAERAVLASIRPEWNEKIFTFEKETEIRKNKPGLAVPFQVLVYSTKPKPELPGLCIDRYGDTLRLGKVFPINYAAARNMGLTLLDGMIIGEFTVYRITEFQVLENGSIPNWIYSDLDKSCVPYKDVANYIGTGGKGFAWNISYPVLYEKPIKLSEAQDVFGLAVPITRAPQSWVYAWPKARCS